MDVGVFKGEDKLVSDEVLGDTSLSEGGQSLVNESLTNVGYDGAT